MAESQSEPLEVEADLSDTNNNVPNVQEIYPYPGKTKSKVWNYFGFYKVKEGPPCKQTLDMSYAVCKICRKKYTNKGNTTNFLTHIEHDHGHRSGGATIKPKPQASMNSFVNVSTTGKISPARQELIDDALSKFIAGKVVPVSIVDNVLFRTFISLLDPRYKVPSRPTIMDRLKKKKDDIEKKLKNDISKTKNVAITHDGWTSLNTESYFTTTIHLIDDNWVLKSAVLGTIKVTGSHTADKIADELSTTRTKWALPQPIATTDNAANEQKAYSILGWERYGCFGHRINLVVKHALEIPEISRLLGKARKLVTFFHQSSSITDLLKNKQKLLFENQTQQNLIGHKLIIDVSTRWNSTLYMLRRLTEQFPVLMSLVNDPSLSKQASTTLKNCIFSFEEQSLVESIVEILSPFEKATTIVCADQSPTMHKILPIIIKLLRIIKINDNDVPVIRKIKEKLLVEINKRTCLDKITILGCVMNPFTKGLSFIEDVQLREDALKYMREELQIENLVSVKVKTEKVDDLTVADPQLPKLELDIEQNNEAIEAQVRDDDIIEEKDDVKEPVAKRVKSADTEDWLDDVVCMSETNPNQEMAAENEIQRYFDAKILEKDNNLTVLEWWRQNEQFYPRLFRIAKKYLAVPASSVPSERVFSLCGQIVDKKRCRLSPQNIDILVFLNKNLEFW